MNAQPSWQELLTRQVDKKWLSFSWITARALISSLNHEINKGAKDFVTELRHTWDAALDDDRIIDRTSDTCFVVLGDPGEQDASQYVLVPALREACAGEPTPDFMVICSDVIYPSGDVNDYTDGFYIPYREQLWDLPIYALPGNHDWYDGLAGFMWHFCGRERLPNSAYRAPDNRDVLNWMSRLLWRRPSKPRADHGFHRPPPAIQPGSYYAIDTRHVLLVCIDTGISGDIDTKQAEWLLRVSELERPKVLLTGKPLVVNGDREPCCIRPDAAAGTYGRYETVDQIVREKRHRYVAAIGGDVHNFQHYRDDGFEYFVSGGGGAYMSATHPNPRLPIEVAVYPTREESIMHFARQVLPRLWRLTRALLLAIAGILGASAWACAEDDSDVKRTVLTWSAVALAATLAGRVLTPARWTREPPFQLFVGFGAVLTGEVIALTGWWLEPADFAENFTVWAALLGGGIVIAATLRATGWWQPARPARKPSALAWLALVGAPFAAAGVTWLISEDWRLALTAFLAVGAGTVCWGLRAHGHWSVAAAIVVATVVQIGVTIAVVSRLVVEPGSADVPALCVLSLVALAVGLLVVLALVGAIALAHAVIAALVKHMTVREGWGYAGPLAQLLLPLVIAGAVGLSGWALDSAGVRDDAWRACLTATMAILTPVGLLFGIDWVRRRSLPRPYRIDLVVGTGVVIALWQGGVLSLPLALAVCVVALAVIGALRFLLNGGAYKLDLALILTAALTVLALLGVQDTWVPRAAAAAAFVVTLTLLGLAVVHLVFIGATHLIFDRGTHRDVEQLTDVEATRLLANRDDPGTAARARRRFDIVFPGEHRPNGPLQQKVAEVFDSDQPPFAKQFLIIESAANRLRIACRAVTGEPNARRPDYVHEVLLP